METDKIFEIISLLFEIYNEENLTKEDILNLLKIFHACECEDEIILKSLRCIKRYQNLTEVLTSIKLIFKFNSGPNIIRNYFKLLPLLTSKNEFKNLQTLLLFLKECREFKEKYNEKFKLPDFINLSDKLESIIFDPDLLPEIQETLICTFAPDLNPHSFSLETKEIVETIYGPNFNLYYHNGYISYYESKISFEYFENIFHIYYNIPSIKYKFDADGDDYEQKCIQNIINLKPEDVHKKIKINIRALDILLRDYLHIKNGFEVSKKEKRPCQCDEFNMNLFEAYFEKNNDKYELSDLHLNSDWVSDKQNQLGSKFTKEEICKLKQTFYLNTLIDITENPYKHEIINKDLEWKDYESSYSYQLRIRNLKNNYYKLNIYYDNGNIVYTYINENDEKDIKIIREKIWDKTQTICEILQTKPKIIGKIKSEYESDSYSDDYIDSFDDESFSEE